jgi:hypothetical protein
MSLSNRWKTGSDFAIGLISSPRSEQDTARKRCPSNDRVAGNKTEKKTVLSTPWEQDSGALHSKRSKALPNQRSVPIAYLATDSNAFQIALHRLHSQIRQDW